MLNASVYLDTNLYVGTNEWEVYSDRACSVATDLTLNLSLTSCPLEQGEIVFFPIAYDETNN
jgi:hypothetical protein